jgi:predicted transcriptional regulator
VAAHYEYLLEHEKILMMSEACAPKPLNPRVLEQNATLADKDIAILRRIAGGNFDKTALIAACEQLDGIGKDKIDTILKRLKKDGLIFGELRDGKTYYALTVGGKAHLHDKNKE